MPKTKFQDFIFTIIMVVLMVFCMTVYNIAYVNGFTYGCCYEALKTMWPEVIAAFIIVKFVANPIVNKLMHKVIDVESAKFTAVAIVRAGCTAFFMCPVMTLFVTILHNGITTQILILWIQKIIINFPFALLLQIFYLGPFVRYLFRIIFRKQLTQTI